MGQAMGEHDEDLDRWYEQNKDRITGHLRSCANCSRVYLGLMRVEADLIASRIIGEGMIKVVEQLEKLV